MLRIALISSLREFSWCASVCEMDPQSGVKRSRHASSRAGRPTRAPLPQHGSPILQTCIQRNAMSKIADDSSSDVVEITPDSVANPPPAPTSLTGNGAQPIAGQPTSNASRPVEEKKTEGDSKGNKEDQIVLNSDKGKDDAGPKESEEPSRMAILQTQINALAGLQSKIATLRSIPTHLIILHQQSPLISFDLDSLLNTDAASGGSMKSHDMGSQAKSAFRLLNEAREEMLKSAAQTALKSAQQSQRDDKLDFFAMSRRARKKR